MNNKAMRKDPLLLLLAFLWQTAWLSAQCTTQVVLSRNIRQEESVPAVSFNVDRVAVTEVGRDRLKLMAVVQALCSSDAMVREISFENLHLNDVPFYAHPLFGRLEVVAGESFRLPLELSVFYRDLESLHVLRVLLAENVIHIRGTAQVELDLGVLGKLLFLSHRAYVPVEFRQEVKMEFPGGETMRTLGLKAIELAEEGWERVERWRGRLRSQFTKALLMARVHFALADGKGNFTEYECKGIGFRISPKEFVLLKSLVEPWKFDVEMAAMRHRGFRVDEKSYDLSVWLLDSGSRDESMSANAGDVFRLRKHQIQLVRKPRDKTEKVWLNLPTGPNTVRLHRRDTAANLSLFEFRDPRGSLDGFDVELKTGVGEEQSRQLVTFRLAREKTSGSERVGVVFLSSSREGQRIVLKTPIDSRAWGAPLVSVEGVVGVVQNENTGLLLTEAFRSLGVKKPLK